MAEKNVAIVRCNSYNRDDVDRALQEMFSLLDMQPWESRQPLLFKPNMLSARRPEEGVTTHPALVSSAIRIIGKTGCLIGDSPANAQKDISLYWKNCGYMDVSVETGAELVRFDKSYTVGVPLNGKTVEVPVTNHIKNAGIVNICKLKTHGLTIMTAAVKNLYGLIPGFQKSLLHSRFMTSYEFSDFLVHFYKTVENKICLNIVDAVVSMEGKGPASGKLRDTRCIIGGTDAVAVDIVCAKLIGADIKRIPYLKIYKDLYGMPEVEISGARAEPFPEFEIPAGPPPLLNNRFLAPVRKLAGRFFRINPCILQEKCKKCRACIEVCPKNAISEKPEIDKNRCIQCLCCFEVCPYKAIDVKKSLLARLFT